MSATRGEIDNDVRNASAEAQTSTQPAHVRVVRNAGIGRVGIDVESSSAMPGWLRIVCTMFPFLRSWGGFI